MQGGRRGGGYHLNVQRGVQLGATAAKERSGRKLGGVGVGEEGEGIFVQAGEDGLLVVGAGHKV